MEKNWEAVKKYYTEKDSAYLDSSLTVTKDTALQIAVFSKNKELLEFLIKHGRWRGEEREGGWNIWGNTPLHGAAATGDIEMARILLELVFNPRNARDHLKSHKLRRNLCNKIIFKSKKLLY